MPTSAFIRRELLWLLAGLLLGMAMPALIWLAGTRVFGPYAGGELGDLFSRFATGLRQGEPVFWLVALSPYGCLALLRALVHALRRPVATE
jgi:hypothetical protein